MCAKLVLSRPKSASTTGALHDLNWLLIRARIEFKILLLMYQCKFGLAPDDLKDLLTSFATASENIKIITEV